MYRFIKFEYLVDLFIKKELHFAHPTKWHDPYEVSLSHTAFESVYAQCWCRRGVSNAMWSIYSPNHLGVRIKTTKTELQNQLKGSPSKVDGCKTRVSPVKYMRQSELDEQLKRHVSDHQRNYQPLKALVSSLFLKRNAFNYESEVRAVFYDPNGDAGDYKRVSVNPHALVKSVLFDPRLPDELVPVYRDYLRDKLDYRGGVGKSQLYKPVKPIPLGEDEG